MSSFPSAVSCLEGGESKKSLLNLALVRGPLPEVASRTIIEEYNRRTNSQIPFEAFLHWTQSSPSGPALHAILETQEGRIVGHQCLFPIRARFGGIPLVAAKSEYTFLNEDYRSAKIAGFEQSARPTHLIASKLLYERGEMLGWSPILISTLPFLYRWARTVGCQAVEIPVTECLLVLKPWHAAKRTLNLVSWQRAALGIAGVAQTLGWRPALLFSEHKSPLRRIPIPQECAHQTNGTLSYFQDSETLQWRYPNDQYEKIAVGDGSDGYLVLKSGSQDGYLRVCQWNLPPSEPRFRLLLSLARHAEKKEALGVRWAVYGTNEEARRLVSRMRKLGFLCARRVRTLLIRSGESKFLEAPSWNLNDSFFSFHH